VHRANSSSRATAHDPYPQAIIFDLDGTLIDSLPGIQCSAREALRTVRPDCELPDLRRYIGPPIGEMFQRVMGDLTPDDLRAVVAVFRRSYDSHGWKNTSLFPGINLVLHDLRRLGIRLFVASNKPSSVAERILEALDLRSCFSAVCCRDSRTPPYSSKSEAVGCLIDTHALNPGAVWMVGDGHDDYRAAQSNGLRFILAAYGYESGRADDPWRSQEHIASPADLLGIVRCAAPPGNR
jgi:phosphoglycolate phosphatase